MYLYKYSKITQDTLDSIRNNYLFFSHPADFNDPFDSCINKEINSNGTNGEVYHESVTPETILTCCFSETPNSILMWSHYADSHKGVCLIFNTRTKGSSSGIMFEDSQLKSLPPENQDFLPVEKVNYKINMLPPYRLKDGNANGEIIEFLLRKCQDWKYEEEWRIIIPENGINTQKIKFKKDSLVGIIFGMNTQKPEEQGVRKIIQEYYINQDVPIVFRKSKPIIGKYAVYPL